MNDSTQESTPQILLQEEPILIDSPNASSTSSTSHGDVSEKHGPPSPSERRKGSAQGAIHQKTKQSSTASSQDKSTVEPSKKRLGMHSHRNSSFEYKETLDATTRHLEVRFNGLLYYDANDL